MPQTISWSQLQTIAARHHLRARILAALWTAAIAAPVAYLTAWWLWHSGEIERNLPTLPGVLDLTVLAVVATAIAGFLCAWPLVDPDLFHEDGGAVGGAIVTWVVAYLILWLLICVSMGWPFPAPGQGSNLLAWPATVLFNLLGYALFVFMSMIWTWYTLVIAIVAGYTLSFVSHW